MDSATCENLAMKTKTKPYCPQCLRDLIEGIDDDAYGMRPICRQCEAEQSHDFDAEPRAQFLRDGSRLEVPRSNG